MKGKNIVNGWFFLDKPLGITSNLALQKIRKILDNCKAGFVGTLDPLASGYLPIALGTATKIISYIEKADKKYLFTIEWGVKTDTGDLEGKINAELKNGQARAQDLKKNMQSVEGDDSLSELQKTSSIIEPVFIQGLKQVINEVTSGKLKLK